MNEFFDDTRGTERINKMREEGMRSQAFYRSGAPSLGIFRSVPKLILIILGIIGILGLLVR